MRFVKGIKNSGKQADRDAQNGQPANPAPSGTTPEDQGSVDSAVADDLGDMFDFLEDGDARKRPPDADQSAAPAETAEITQLPIKRTPIKRAPVKRNSVGVVSPKHSPAFGLPSTAANHPATDATDTQGSTGRNATAPEQKLPDDRTGNSSTDDQLDTNFDFLSDEQQSRGSAEGLFDNVAQQSRVDRQEMFDTGGFGPATRSEGNKGRLAAIALGLLSAVGAAGYVYYTQYSQRPVDSQFGDLVVDSNSIDSSSPIDRSSTGTLGLEPEESLTHSSNKSDTQPAEPTLRERRDDTINSLRSLITIAEFDTAAELLATMDPVLYGYGQIEFVEFEKIAAELREKPGSPELLAKLDSIGVSTTVSIGEPAIEQAKSAAEIQSSEAERIALAEQELISNAAALAEQERQLELARLAEEIDAAREIKAAEIDRQAALASEAETARIVVEKATADRLAEQVRQAEEARLAEQARQAEEAQLAEQARQAEEAQLAEQARQAEEAQLAEQARQAEEAQLAEQARQAEEAQLAEQARQAEEVRLAEQARQAEEARLAEQARQVEETRLAALSASTTTSAELNTRQQQFQQQQVELARRALEQQRAAEALALRQENVNAARLNKTAEDERRAKLLQKAEAEAQRRSQQQELSTLQPPQTVQRQRVTDADMEIVWRRFAQLKSAVEVGDMTAILKLSEPSGAKVQMYLQLFENFEKINVRITNLAAQNRAEIIHGTLRIVSMVRANGDVTYPSDKYRDNLLTSKRENGQWSRIKW